MRCCRAHTTHITRCAHTRPHSTRDTRARQLPDDEDALDGEDLEALHESVENDYEMGESIRAKLIPHAVEW
jgi:hypothetical protein